MGRSFHLARVGFATISAFVLLAQAQAISTDSLLQQIPDGIQAGNSDAQYGSYNSVLSESARPYQDRLFNLENKIAGLSQLPGSIDQAKRSQMVYLLENTLVALQMEIMDDNVKMEEFDRQALQFATIHAYRSLRTHSEYLFEDVIRYVDRKLPGATGVQDRQDINNLPSLYQANYRSDKPLSEEERKAAYKQKLKEFLSAGGSLDEIHLLTPEFYQGLGTYTWLEYIVLESNQIWVTQGKAGHLLLAGGQPVKSAGQIVFLKNKQGRISMVIVSNASGNYKPDIMSAQYVADLVSSQLGLPYEDIVVTKGEPLSTQLTKLFLKGEGMPKDQIQTTISNLEATAKKFYGQPASLRNCQSFFTIGR